MSHIKKPIGVTIGVFILLAVLLALLPTRALMDKETSTQSLAPDSTSAWIKGQAAHEELVRQITGNMGPEVAGEWLTLHNRAVSGDKTTLDSLKKSWDKLFRPEVSSFYYALDCQHHGGHALDCGLQFLKASRNTNDSILRPYFLTSSRNYLQLVDSNSAGYWDARAGLAAIVVLLQTRPPMEGISALKEVIENDPGNLTANVELGLFSMQTAQWDKAVGYLRTATRYHRDPEAWFYLGQALEGAGETEQAQKAMEMVKALVAAQS